MTQSEVTGSTARRRTQAERTALSDQRLFDAATTLLLEKGTLDTTLKDVGERAGYSRGLASYRFGTKENLFRELLTRIERDWSEQFRVAMQGKRGLAAFKQTLVLFDSFIFGDVSAYRAAMILRFEALAKPSETTERIRRLIEIQRGQVERWIREGVEDSDIDPAIDARAFASQHMSFLYGTMYQLVLSPQAITRSLLLDDYLQTFLRAYGTAAQRGKAPPRSKRR